MEILNYSTESELLSSKELDNRCQLLARHLNELHVHHPKNTLFLCVLPGGYRFFSDLTKYIAFTIHTEFMKVDLVDGKTICTMLNTVDETIQFDRIIVVTDIVNTGKTLSDIVAYCESKYLFAGIIPIAILVRSNTIIQNSKLHNLHALADINSTQKIVGYGIEDISTGLFRQSPSIIEYIGAE